MTKQIVITLLTTMFLATIGGVTAGCNTVEGAGKDVEQGGKAIKDEANEHRN